MQTGSDRSVSQLRPQFDHSFVIFVHASRSIPSPVFEFFGRRSKHMKTSQRCVVCHKLLNESTATAQCCASSSSALSFDPTMFCFLNLCLPHLAPYVNCVLERYNVDQCGICCTYLYLASDVSKIFLRPHVLVFHPGQVRKVTYLGSSFHAAVIFDPEVRIGYPQPMGS